MGSIDKWIWNKFNYTENGQRNLIVEDFGKPSICYMRLSHEWLKDTKDEDENQVLHDCIWGYWGRDEMNPCGTISR